MAQVNDSGVSDIGEQPHGCQHRGTTPNFNTYIKNEMSCSPASIALGMTKPLPMWIFRPLVQNVPGGV